MTETDAPPSSSFSIGNCQVKINGNACVSEDDNQKLQISVLDAAKIVISVNRTSGRRTTRRTARHSGELCQTIPEGSSFLVLNPKNVDVQGKLLLQNVLKIYKEELPSMKFVATTGKESNFLEKCVLSGKYCTVVLKSNAMRGFGGVVAAISYQIIPADTQFAEIPVAAVRECYQHKGIGRLLFMELKRRLQNVGILTVFCWGDKVSEGFWLKQGFVTMAEVDTKGRARKLPIKADVRRAMCFPGCSTLLVAHLNKDISTPIDNLNATPPRLVPSCDLPHFCLVEPEKSVTKTSPTILIKTPGILEAKMCHASSRTNFPMEIDAYDPSAGQDVEPKHEVLKHSRGLQECEGTSPRGSGSLRYPEVAYQNVKDHAGKTSGIGASTSTDTDHKPFSCAGRRVKRKIHKDSAHSFDSKEANATHQGECSADTNEVPVCEEPQNANGSAICCGPASLEVGFHDPQERISLSGHTQQDAHVSSMLIIDNNPICLSVKEHPLVMLANIAEDTKKEHPFDSKEAKPAHQDDCYLYTCEDHVCEGSYNDFGASSAEVSYKFPQEQSGLADHAKENMSVSTMSPSDSNPPWVSSKEHPVILLMNIADDNKKKWLTKIVEDLGGSVSSYGSFSTHVVTGVARRTLNFCSALSVGAWIVSPKWLKESFREGRFIGELPFILEDEEYRLKYNSDLKDAVLRARASPRSLLKGYHVYLSSHIQPPVDVLSTIVGSCGGHLLEAIDEVKEPSKTIVVACEEDMEEAIMAAKEGMLIYNSDWLLSCVMRQQLDFEAPQFAESL
ncbi:uncharacterized protein LOC18433272 [Amborella trichopoda]|uniref:BRCT domain-containing protein n=1 Tax=Amborella trichopoda TaxID=13333 RepID=W1PBM6_AMBTC|nr:uncharacterized protein LOC18433272 [Amborella trichopoda]ERN05104.1 hypothetical protein AMTR_s00053p00154080 [Amborella trichopoda]|eukprot:XP_020522253.1 uncharacterized protein LOC18433272 [Amborella trichopoda]